jgi:hypothetical protein
MQTVWEFPTGENDLGVSPLKGGEKSVWSYLLRRRRTMFHPSLFHGEWLQTRLIFECKPCPHLLRAKSFHLREMRKMKVNIEIAGLPLYKTFGKNKKIEFEFIGKTLKELIDAMVRKFGFEVKKFLLDKNGNIDMDIRVLLNGATYLSENRMQTSLNDGDTLIFKAPS